MWLIIRRLRTVIVRAPSRNMTIAVILVAVIIVIGGRAFAIYDGVSWATGIYWAITTATTVGYGDVIPKTGIGRVIAVMVMLTTIPLMGYVFAEIASIAVESRIRRWLGVRTVTHLKNAIVILGDAHWVIELLAALESHHGPTIVLSPQQPAHARDDIHWVQGDPDDVEAHAQLPLAAARAVVLGLDTDAGNLLAAISLRHQYPDLTILSMPESERVASAMRDLGVAVHAARDPLLGHIVAKSLDSPDAGRLLFRLLLNDGYRLEESRVPTAWVGKRFNEARRQDSGVCLALVQADDLYLGVEQDPLIDADAKILRLIEEKKSGRQRSQ